MNIRKLGDYRPKVLIFNGSPRRLKSCANQSSKTQKLVEWTIDKWMPFIDFEYIDLSVGKVNIQPCKGCISTSNGFHCHWKCVAEDQRVHTIDGFKQIKDLKIGDILQDGNKVINHVKTSEQEEIFEVKLKDGRRLELTKDHKVKVLSKKRKRDIGSNWKYYRDEKWVEVQNLKIGDLIPTIQTDNIFNDYNNLNLDYLIYGLIWGDGTFVNESVQLYVDKKEDLFLNEIIAKLNDYIISILPHKINHESKINTNRKYDTEYDTEILKVNFGTKFGRKMIISGFEKTKATYRRLPIESFKNNSQIFSFLNGWISTDGSISEKGISIYNTSYDCLRDLQLLLSRVGIRSSISDIRHKSIEVRGKMMQRCSSINIFGYNSVKIIYDNLELLHTNKQKRLEKYILNVKKKMSNKPSSIKSIKSIGYKPVYDIEVENSHQFNCEGINIHNCSCYEKGSKTKPDLMYDADIYNKLEKCDGFIVISPIHWYSVSTQVKAMFDRLVCVNQTITKEQAEEIFGVGNIKNSEITGNTELQEEYKHLLKNHLEGKWAAFFVHGDDGANDYNGNPPYTGDKEWDVRNSVMPLVHQCRYSGINCPDDLVEAFYVNKGKPYYQANLDFEQTNEFFERMDGLIERLLDYLG
jgi:multimeric flavodoxin WrbA